MQTLFASLRTNLAAIPTEPCVAMPGDPCSPLTAPTEPCVATPVDPCAPQFDAAPALEEACLAERFELADLAWSSSTPAWLADVLGEG